MSAYPPTHGLCGTSMIDCPRHEFAAIYCPKCETCYHCEAKAKGWEGKKGWEGRTGSSADMPSRNLYTERLEWRRADQKAMRELAAESRPPIRKPEVLTLRERLARPREPVRWRIDGWQPANSRVMLAAQYKAGKTTLIANLVRSLVDLEPFFDAHTVAGVAGTVVVLDFEMSPHQLDDWYADLKIRADERIIVIPLRGSAAAFDIVDPDIRKQWAEMLKARSCGYLVVDCLRPILDAIGLDEHREAGRFLTALDALLSEAEIPDACVAHHMGHVAERSRGDSRIRDWPDTEWRLVREDDDPASPRYISAYGRDVEISESRLVYDPSSRRLSIGGGSRKDAAARAALEDIVKLLGKDDGLSGKKIEETLLDTTEHKRMPIRSGLKIGVKEGRIGVHAGPKNAKLYFLAEVRTQ